MAVLDSLRVDQVTTIKMVDIYVRTVKWRDPMIIYISRTEIPKFRLLTLCTMATD